jgi:hypothetical protein
MSPNKQAPHHTLVDNVIIFIRVNKKRTPDPKFTLPLKNPQNHRENYITKFYKNTTQLQIKYIHILILPKLKPKNMQEDNTIPNL